MTKDDVIKLVKEEMYLTVQNSLANRVMRSLRALEGDDPRFYMECLQVRPWPRHVTPYTYLALCTKHGQHASMRASLDAAETPERGRLSTPLGRPTARGWVSTPLNHPSCAPTHMRTPRILGPTMSESATHHTPGPCQKGTMWSDPLPRQDRVPLPRICSLDAGASLPVRGQCFPEARADISTNMGADSN